VIDGGSTNGMSFFQGAFRPRPDVLMTLSKSMFPKALPVCLVVLFMWASPAYAQDILDKGTSLVRTLLTFVQAMASLLCVGAMIRAGLAFTQVNEYEQAIDRLKSTIIACAIVFSAVGTVQLIKNHFGQMTLN
jgi:c-di-GMP-related signal transduction protein